MSRMSELDLDRQAIAAIGDPEHEVGYSIYQLMGATQSLSDISASSSKRHLLQAERNEIEQAYACLGRLLSQLPVA